MKKRINVFEVLGLLLIACSLGTLLISRVIIKNVTQQAQKITHQIEAFLPESTPGFPGDYTDPIMPVLQIEQKDYVGLLNIPAYGFKMPLANEWYQFHLFSGPVRFCGSVYDGTMIVGGNDLPEQFDFFDQMEPGDHVAFTDMVGTVFTFTVERIERSKSAEYEKLSAGGYPLTLFVRSAYSSEYILVRCVTEAK